MKPAVAAKTKAVAHTAAIFNAHDDEEEEEEDSSESKDGFQPKRGLCFGVVYHLAFCLSCMCEYYSVFFVPAVSFF